MRSIKICSVLMLMLVFSVGCEKETIDLPVEDAKASEELTFLEFLNSGIDVKEYFAVSGNEGNNKSYNKSDSGSSYFEENCDNLPVEDFEEAQVPIGGGGLVAAPLWEGSPAGKFQPGEIQSGLIITTEDFNSELTVYGDAFRENETRLITSRRDQSLILQFTEDDVFTVGLDVSIYQYDIESQIGDVTVEVFNSEGEELRTETITTSRSGTFWTFFANESISEIILSSTDYDGWVGVDNIAFGSCDSDGDGCLDNVDPIIESNMEPSVVIGGCDSAVPNRSTSECGISLSDLVDVLEEDETYKNKGQFIQAVAHATNEWVSAGLISSEEKDGIVSCAANAS